MKPFFWIGLVLAAILSSTASAQSWQQAWPGGNLTCTVLTSPAPAGDGVPDGALNYFYSNYTWKDPNGVSHTFVGTSSDTYQIKRPARIDAIAYVEVFKPLTATSTDGQWRLVGVVGTEGTVGTVGTVYPKFQVLSIIYAPPGHIGTLGSVSTADYSKSTVVGSSYSIAQTFGGSASVLAGFGASDGKNNGFGGNFTAGFTYKVEKDNTWSITRTTSMGTSYPGPNESDGIDHDYDIITLWLNPGINLLKTSQSTIYWNYTNHPQDLPPAGWNPAVDGMYMDTVDVYLGQLTGRLPMDSKRADKLSRAWNTSLTNSSGLPPGVDPNVDYYKIYTLDPFWAARDGAVSGTSIDLNRFSLVAPQPQNGFMGYFNYFPAASGISPISQTMTLNYTNDTTSKISYTDEYSVKAEATGGFLFGATVTIDLTYTNQRTEEISNSQNQEFKVSITPPAYSNPQPNAPGRIWLYQDNVYGTYMFWGQ